MGKIICIDGGNVMFKAIFAFRKTYNIPAPYTYCRMIIGYLKKLNFTSEDKVIIAQDYGKSWRKDVDKKYKAQRKDQREQVETKEWWTQRFKEFDDLVAKLDISVPWHFVKLWRMEADDIAAVACRYYKNNEVILVSSDKDWEMLCQYSNVKIFSTITKKFKIVKHPLKVLLEKIQGDISDNLLKKPSSEREFEQRKTVVNLLELPIQIESEIRQTLEKLTPKSLVLHKVPYHTIQNQLEKLYAEGDNDEDN